MIGSRFEDMAQAIAEENFATYRRLFRGSDGTVIEALKAVIAEAVDYGRALERESADVRSLDAAGRDRYDQGYYQALEDIEKA